MKNENSWLSTLALVIPAFALGVVLSPYKRAAKSPSHKTIVSITNDYEPKQLRPAIAAVFGYTNVSVVFTQQVGGIFTHKIYLTNLFTMPTIEYKTNWY